MTQEKDSCGCSQVCNLPEAEREDRLTLMRTQLMPKAVNHERLSDGAAWEFPIDMRAELEDLVRFERECCPTLGWQLRAAGTDRLRLEVTGVDPDSELLTTMLRNEGPKGGFLKSSLLGLSASFFVFCVLPIGAVALGGGALASSMSRFDNPYVIGGGALAFGALAWHFDRRRKRQTGAC